jgi:hypothetical protein
MTPKRPRDPNQLAKSIIDLLLPGRPRKSESRRPLRPRAGLRAAHGARRRLTPEQRAEASRLAAQARWRRKED